MLHEIPRATASGEVKINATFQRYDGSRLPMMTLKQTALRTGTLADLIGSAAKKSRMMEKGQRVNREKRPENAKRVGMWTRFSSTRFRNTE